MNIVHSDLSLGADRGMYKTINFNFPKFTRDELMTRSYEHALQVAESYASSRDGKLNFPDIKKIDRLCVNMLRHEFTDYDETSSNRLQQHMDACNAIALHYPWLTKQCEKQIRTRSKKSGDEEDIA